MLKKEKVYSIIDGKIIFAFRQSNQTLLVRKGQIIDSDRSVLEDKNGYHYARCIKEEIELSYDKWIFRMR